MNDTVQIVLGSRNRIRILEYLTYGPSHISGISNELGISHTSTDRHVKILTTCGLLKESRYGKIRMIEARFTAFEVSFIEDEGLIMEIQSKPRESIVFGEGVPVPEYKQDRRAVPIHASKGLRKKVFQRDQDKCVVCRRDENIIIHHVDEDKENNVLGNLVVLCRSCHGRIHRSKSRQTYRDTVTKHLSQL